MRQPLSLKIAMALLLSAALAGCSSSWSKAGASDAQRDADLSRCKTFAKDQVVVDREKAEHFLPYLDALDPNAAAKPQPFDAQKVYDTELHDCMTADGYQSSF
jgi:hypothetical protein